MIFIEYVSLMVVLCCLADDIIYTTVVRIPEVYLHDRPANRQRMRMGYIHDGHVNYIREFYLHDRPANRQRIRMGYIHDGRVNYIREFYYTTVTCGIDVYSTHGWGLPCK